MTKQPINILYVDDYPLDRELVRDALEKEDGGFQIIETASRAEFETRLAEGDYDLVLSDFNILGFEGLQVIDTVRAEKGPLPVIILTGTGSEEVAVEAMKRGAADYIIKKPEYIRRLPLTLRAVLDRVRAEEALQEQHSTLRSIIDSVDALVFSVDRQYCYTSFNQAYAAAMKTLYGAEIEMGCSLLDYMTVTEDREIARRNLDRALAGEQLVEETYSGEELRSRRYFRVSHSPIKNEAGQVIGVAVLAQDMTERKQAEDAFRESREKYYSLIQKVQTAIVLHDGEGRTLAGNPMAQCLLGLSEDQLLDRDLIDLEWHFLREDGSVMPVAEYPVSLVLASGQPLRDYVAGIHQADQDEITWVLVNAEPEYDDAGEIAQIIVSFIDLTGRKRAEEALRESEAKFSNAFQSSPAALSVSAVKDRVYLDVNESFLRLTGYTRPEVVGHSSSELNLWAEPEQGQQFRRLFQEHGSVHNFEYTYRRKDGSLGYGLASAIIITVGGEACFLAQTIDITERKQAEQSIVLMNFALDNIHEAAFLVDENMRTHYVNEEACRILGYTREELLDLSVADVDPDFPAERWTSHWDELKTHRSLIFESRHKTKDGRLIPVEINANYFEYDGQSYNLGLVRDITERKQAEQERLAHLRFLECMEQINRAIQGTNDLEQMMSDVLDLVLSIFECDRAWFVYPCDLEAATWRVPMERTRPEYPGALILNLEMPIDSQAVRVYKAVLASDDPVGFGPGNEQPLPADVAKKFNEQSQLAMAIYPKVYKPYIFGIHQCSRPRVWTPEERRLLKEIGRQMENALTSLLMYRNLQESENRYRRITEGLTDYQYSVRVEDGCAVETTQSQACETVTGYTPEEFAADPYLWFHMIAPEDRKLVQDRIQQILAGKEIPPLEHRLVRKDGAVRWVRDTTILFKDASGKLLGYDGIIKDITQRRQAEEEIRTLNQELEQRVLERTAQLEAANKELEAFAYSVSHDLRAPLRHIDGFLELLHRRLAGMLDERSRHYMDTIAGAATRMGQLIDDLLTFSRMGRNELSKMPVDLAGLVQEIVREFEPEIQSRTVHWRIADLPIVTGDRAMLRLVLTNLLSNALKFTRECAQVDIEVGCQADEKETIIFIRDNGVGFDMAYADKLFGVFQRLHTADEFEGTGIGLANVRRIIQRHGGRTWAKGKINQGATFYFSLPHTTQEI